ncbi:helix-turn-helix domain-containing protein [Prosthecobacter sp.]|uniref:helix-turn-helix transcriptional regulator n=1 Tax=Prosthecobacter sp. TaxID=1965333 RepID=UPI00378523F1
MPRDKPKPQPRISLRERQISGGETGWSALQSITASEGFLAERVDWHSHEGVEVLMFLRGAAEYEFRGGRRLVLTGDHILIVPPGLRHRAARDVRSPTVHSSITIDLDGAARSGCPFTRAELDWLRTRLWGTRPEVRAMTPLLRRRARVLHRMIHQHPQHAPAPDEAAVLRLQIAGILIEAAKAGEGLSSGREAGLVTAAIAHLELHFDKPLQMDAVAETIGCSRSRFYAAFRRETGMSPNDWLLRLRVDKALALLAGDATPSVREIAHATGFSSHAYFCQVIRKYTGRSPGEHRTG